MPKDRGQNKDSPTDEQRRYGRQWSEWERQRRQDQEREREEPDYGGPFGL